MGTQFEHVASARKPTCRRTDAAFHADLPRPNHKNGWRGRAGGVTFAADVDETVEIIDGKCRIRIGPDGDWTACEGGQRFHIPARTRFEVDAREPVHYVTHLGRNGAARGA